VNPPSEQKEAAMSKVTFVADLFKEKCECYMQRFSFTVD